MKYNQVHTRSVLEPGDYEFTITQAVREGNFLRLAHTVNTGKFAYQHIIEKIPVVGTGVSRLRRMCDSLNYQWVGNTTDDDFPAQFVGLRGKMTVSLRTDGEVIKNYIVGWDVSTRRPEYDVTKEKTDDHYFTQKKPKGLPI